MRLCRFRFKKISHAGLGTEIRDSRSLSGAKCQNVKREPSVLLLPLPALAGTPVRMLWLLYINGVPCFQPQADPEKML